MHNDPTIHRAAPSPRAGRDHAWSAIVLVAWVVVLATGCASGPREEVAQPAAAEAAVTTVGAPCQVQGWSFTMPTVSVSIGIGDYAGVLQAYSSPAFAVGAARMDDIVARLCAADPSRCLRMRLFSLPAGGESIPPTVKAIAKIIDTPSLHVDRFAESDPGADLAALDRSRVPVTPGALDNRASAQVVLNRIRAAVEAADLRARRAGEALLLVYVAGAMTIDAQRRAHLLAADSRAGDPASMIPLDRIVHEVGAFTRAVSKTRERRHAVLFIDGRDAAAGSGAPVAEALRALPPPARGLALVVNGAAGPHAGAVRALEARMAGGGPGVRPAEPIRAMAAPFAGACALVRLGGAVERSGLAEPRVAKVSHVVHAEEWMRQIALELDRLLPDAGRNAAESAGSHSIRVDAGRPLGGPILRLRVD